MVYLAIYLVIFLIVKPGITGNSVESKEELFAGCLTDSDATMYGTVWCSYCQEQKKLFGRKAFKEIDFVDCDADLEICREEGIKGYPTWKINGKSYSGTQSLETLSVLTGCKY